MSDDAKDLKQLGSSTQYKYEGPSADILETFPNPEPDRPYRVIHETSEFTSLCPKTGQPDFADIKIEMIPRLKCIESKSLKLYLFAYRNHGAFMERIVNTILNDLVAVCHPIACTVVGTFGARGGIQTTIDSEYFREHDPYPPIDLDEKHVDPEAEVEPKATFLCNWCPDPYKFCEVFHPDGGPAHVEPTEMQCHDTYGISKMDLERMVEQGEEGLLKLRALKAKKENVGTPPHFQG